jgi:hypothetical protein
MGNPKANREFGESLHVLPAWRFAHAVILPKKDRATAKTAFLGNFPTFWATRLFWAKPRRGFRAAIDAQSKTAGVKPAARHLTGLVAKRGAVVLGESL